jgi:hypothetical protein
MQLGTPGASVPSLAPTPAYPAVPSANTTPSLAAPPTAETQPNRTFDNGTPTETNKPSEPSAPIQNGTPVDPNKPMPQSRLLLPAPPATQDTTRGALRGLDPEDQDRVTAVPLRPSFAVRPASLITRTPAPAQPQAAGQPRDSDWRAASR